MSIADVRINAVPCPNGFAGYFVAQYSNPEAAERSHSHGAIVRDRHHCAVGGFLSARARTDVRSREEVSHVVVGKPVLRPIHEIESLHRAVPVHPSRARAIRNFKFEI